MDYSNNLAGAIIGHLIGDFLLQNDFLAKWKKIDWEICTFHCAIWTICVMACAGWFERSPNSLLILCILFITHFIQDHTSLVSHYMKFMGQSEFQKPPLGPWSVIVVDNVLHLLVIFIIWRFVYGA